MQSMNNNQLSLLLLLLQVSSCLRLSLFIEISLGKTYASYYAMNKVLTDSHDPHGICVYIAPTKALVNQVAGRLSDFAVQ